MVYLSLFNLERSTAGASAVLLGFFKTFKPRPKKKTRSWSGDAPVLVHFGVPFNISDEYPREDMSAFSNANYYKITRLVTLYIEMTE